MIVKQTRGKVNQYKKQISFTCTDDQYKAWDKFAKVACKQGETRFGLLRGAVELLLQSRGEGAVL